MGGGPGHEHGQRHDHPRGRETGGVRQQPVPWQNLPHASAGIQQWGRREDVFTRQHIPDGRLPHCLSLQKPCIFFKQTYIFTCNYVGRGIIF